MIRAAILALAYVGMIAALLWAASMHHRVSVEAVMLVMSMAAIAGLVVFIDETRQQRRKWRDHPNRRNGILKEWNE